MENEKKGHSLLIAILLVIILLLLSLVGYFIYNDYYLKEDTKENTTTEYKTDELVTTIGKELYNKAYQLYWTRDLVISDQLYDIGEENDMYLIENYNDIKLNFTATGLTDFVEYFDIVEKDGKYYIGAAARGADIEYISTELKLIDYSSNIATFSAISSYCNTNYEDIDVTNCEKANITNTTDKFVIKMVNDKWLIDTFVLPN